MSFNSLSQTQKTNLRNAFELIDQDKDGLITRDDIVKLYKTLDTAIKDEQIAKMLEYGEGSGINFTKFLSIMSAELSKLSSRSELYKALKIFDDRNTESRELEVDLPDLRDNILNAGVSEEQFDQITAGFIKEEMTGRKVFLGTRWIETYIDS